MTGEDPADRLGEVADDLARVACDVNDVASDLDDRANRPVRTDGSGVSTATPEQWRPRPVDDEGYRQTMSRLAFGGSGLGLMYAGTQLASFDVVGGAFATLLAAGAGLYGVRLKRYEPPAVQGGEDGA